MRARSRLLLTMIFVQACVCALLGTGFGLGLCTIAGEFAAEAGYPFRMLWYAPLTGAMIVFLVSVVAAGIGAVLVPKLEPCVVFAGR
jgi:putative ABC transport system permease protein